MQSTPQSLCDNQVGLPLRAPMFPDVGVMALVPHEWEIPWQPRHQILIRLARYFHILWCTPAPWWRQWGHRDGKEQNTDSCIQLPPGLIIYRPQKWLPEIGRPGRLALWIQKQRLKRAQQQLRDRGCKKIILYLWRPSYESALDLVDYDVSSYHIDDEYTFSEIEQPLAESEARLIKRVDQVFIHSHALIEKKGNLNPRTVFVPNGADFQSFSIPHPEPPDLAAIPHPRIGYVGRIKRQLDSNLLLTLAQTHHEWSFVFVGPQSGSNGQSVTIRELSHLRNVYFLGNKSVVELPGYTQHLDVCMLCYVLNDYTRFIYPLKLHEYLATGRPIVGSPIDALLEFDHLIRLARTPDEWSHSIQAALTPEANSATQIRARMAMASRHDWNGLVDIIAQEFLRRLSECCRISNSGALSK